MWNMLFISCVFFSSHIKMFILIVLIDIFYISLNVITSLAAKANHQTNQQIALLNLVSISVLGEPSLCLFTWWLQVTPDTVNFIFPWVGHFRISMNMLELISGNCSSHLEEFLLFTCCFYIPFSKVRTVLRLRHYFLLLNKDHPEFYPLWSMTWKVDQCHYWAETIL